MAVKVGNMTPEFEGPERLQSPVSLRSEHCEPTLHLLKLGEVGINRFSLTSPTNRAYQDVDNGIVHFSLQSIKSLMI